MLFYWGRVTHICVGKLTIIGSDNGLWPGRRQAIIWTNAGILLIRSLGTNFSLKRNSYIFIQEMHMKTSSAKWRLFCFGLNVLIIEPREAQTSNRGRSSEYRTLSFTQSKNKHWSVLAWNGNFRTVISYLYKKKYFIAKITTYSTTKYISCRTNENGVYPRKKWIPLV